MKAVKIIFLVLAILVAISFTTGYGINYSTKISNGKVKCQYISAKGTFSVNYFYSENAIMGVRECQFINK